MRSLLPLLFALVAGSAAQAQSYPAKPVRILIGQAAGAPIDVTTRLIAEQLRERFGQPFVVDNRVGAAGRLAMEGVTSASADGYTLLAAFDSQLTVAPSVFANFPVDPVRQLVPIAIFGDAGASVLVVASQLPVNSLSQLVEHARRNPGTLNYASGGHGTNSNILSEMLKRAAGIDLQHIPHKGPVAATAEVVAQRVSMYISPPGTIIGQIRAGTLRPLAVAAPRRAALLPEVPTFAESGYPAVNPPAWWLALLAPAGVPDDIVGTLNAEIVRIVHTPKLRERLAAQGVEPGSQKPAEAALRLRRESEFWREVVRSLEIKAE